MASKPPDFRMPDGKYAGDVTPDEAWQTLAHDPEARLVDVRTEIEWNLIGRPDLSSIGREPIYLQWVTMQGPNVRFVEELAAALEHQGTPQAAPIYFLCQSGGRSKIAAMQCTGLGYTHAYNIADGFEGALDEHKHRNSLNGWKVAGLPWRQT